MSGQYQTIFVVAWQEPTAAPTVEGFDWSYDYAGAVRQMQTRMQENEDGELNLTLTRLRVPFALGPLGIAEFLDHQLRVEVTL
jgi:hypothetical protein